MLTRRAEALGRGTKKKRDQAFLKLGSSLLAEVQTSWQRKMNKLKAYLSAQKYPMPHNLLQGEPGKGEGKKREQQLSKFCNYLIIIKTLKLNEI